MDRFRRTVGRVVRSEAYHAFWLCVWGMLVPATIYDYGHALLTGGSVRLAASVPLVFAMSLETALATHAGAWSAELAAESGHQ